MAPLTGTRVTSQLKDRIMYVTLSDPKSKNSLSLEAAEELNIQLGTARSLLGTLNTESLQRPLIGLIFSATGRVFCSGGNLRDYAKMKTPEQGKIANRRIKDVLQNLHELALPTVCLVDGDCLGGGLELISAFDHVISSPHSLFGFWQRRIGLSHGWGGGTRLAARIGDHRLKQYTLSSSNLIATEALAVGLIDRIVPSTLALEEACALIRSQQNLPQAPVSSLKKRTSFIDTEAEKETFESLWLNKDHLLVLKKWI